MNDNSPCLDKNKNIIRDTLFTDNEEKEIEKEENNSQKNFIFNLEYQKIINSNEGQSNKVNSELKKLIDFVRERDFYRDINGNRITPKGTLIPTPFQKLQKMNEEIKNYYETKLNRKNSPLIVKNYRNKYLNTNYHYKVYKSLSNMTKRKKNNYFSPKKNDKKLEKINLIKKLKNNKTSNNKNGLILSINENINEHNKINNNNNYKVCFSETFKVKKTKYFHDSQFNQINYWKAKMLYPPILNKNNNVEKKLQTNSIYKHYITEYKKRNHKNEIKNLISNINNKNEKNNFNRNSMNNMFGHLKSLSKVKDFSKDLNKYDLIQFNMNHLIKQDPNKKDKIILNIRKTLKSLSNRKNIKNKTINVNIDNKSK